MLELPCIALIIYMEARNQPERTQADLASFAISKATKLEKSVCDTLKIKHLYSWNWDKKNTVIDKTLLKEKIYPVVSREIKKKSKRMENYMYFNSCKGKKFPGKVMKSNDVCFYTGKL